jgi:hypothetical protein
MKTGYLLSVLLIIFLGCNQTESKKPIPAQPYSEKTACLFSQIAYCTDPQKELSQYLTGWKIVWNPEAVNGNYAFVATNDTTYAIAIRGSLIEFTWEAFENWIYQDLNVASQQDWKFTNDKSKAKIAQGAYNAWENMNKMKDKISGKTLQEFLKNKTDSATPILITGHSLGGNLATVYASWLWQNFKNSGSERKKINVITFAAPAAGDKYFAQDFNTKFPNSIRFENTNDIVPKFPNTETITKLGDLYSPSPSAEKITVGFNSMTVSLKKTFSLISTAMKLLEWTKGNSAYLQTNSDGNLITVSLSGKNSSDDINGWLAEAGYQHSVAQYATQLKLPVVVCNQ